MKILVMEHPFQTVFLITKKKKQKLIFNYSFSGFYVSNSRIKHIFACERIRNMSRRLTGNVRVTYP